ncbi:MAG: hypothetical protein ACI9DK_002496 [Vicingaceae bacterium]|jgi:hypothetical protein
MIDSEVNLQSHQPDSRLELWNTKPFEELIRLQVTKGKIVEGNDFFLNKYLSTESYRRFKV